MRPAAGTPIVVAVVLALTAAAGCSSATRTAPPPGSTYGQRVADAVSEAARRYIEHGATSIVCEVGSKTQPNDHGVTCRTQGGDVSELWLSGVSTTEPATGPADRQIIDALRRAGASGVSCKPATLVTTVCIAARPHIRVLLNGNDVASG
jgi:hypothetical protein